eukprot:PhF_6_TR26377/c0_g2_i1/m.38033
MSSPTLKTPQRKMSVQSTTFFICEANGLNTIITGAIYCEKDMSVNICVQSAEKIAKQFFRLRSSACRKTHHFQEIPSFNPADVVSEVTLPNADSKGHIDEYLSSHFHKEMSPDAPMWDVVLLHTPKFVGVGCVVIVRISHAIGDGVALATALYGFLDEAPGHQQEMIDEVKRVLNTRGSSGGKSAGWLTKPLKMSLAVWGVMVALHTPFLPGDPKSTVRGPSTNRKRFISLQPLPLDEMKKVGHAFGATVNDLMLSCLAGALQRTCAKGGRTPYRHIRCCIPVNLEAPAFNNPDERMGNRFGIYMLPMDLRVVDPVERIHRVMWASYFMKRSMEAPAIPVINWILYHTIPSKVYQWLLFAYTTKYSCLTTNVRGPTKPLTLGGNRVVSINGFVCAGHSATNVIVFSYCGHVEVGMMVDEGVIPDSQVVCQGFIDEYNALKKVAEAIPMNKQPLRQSRWGVIKFFISDVTPTVLGVSVIGLGLWKLTQRKKK